MLRAYEPDKELPDSCVLFVTFQHQVDSDNVCVSSQLISALACRAINSDGHQALQTSGQFCKVSVDLLY